jgi:SAM-dependent methyltransferase
MSDYPFAAERLEKLAAIESRHFWFAARRRLTGRLLRTYLHGLSLPVLDVGCGTGSTVQALLDLGYRAVGVDLRPEGLLALRSRIPGAALVQADVTRLPLASGTFGGALLLDVLEHVEDAVLLAEVRRVTVAGATLVAAVPAMPWLWSYRDKDAGHLRRYTRNSFTAALENAGFEIREMHFYQCLLFPLAVASRLMGRNGPRLRDLEESAGGLLNEILKRVNLAEVRLGERIRWPWGLSLIAACRRR